MSSGASGASGAEEGGSKETSSGPSTEVFTFAELKERGYIKGCRAFSMPPKGVSIEAANLYNIRIVDEMGNPVTKIVAELKKDGCLWMMDDVEAENIRRAYHRRKNPTAGPKRP